VKKFFLEKFEKNFFCWRNRGEKNFFRKVCEKFFFVGRSDVEKFFLEKFEKIFFCWRDQGEKIFFRKV
jgi:hypothetical protein